MKEIREKLIKENKSNQKKQVVAAEEPATCVTASPSHPHITCVCVFAVTPQESS